LKTEHRASYQKAYINSGYYSKNGCESNSNSCQH